MSRVDIVMGTSPQLFQALSAWFVSVIKRTPFLLEIRDLWPEFAIEMGVLKNRFVIHVARWLERFLYRRAKLIVVNSPAYSDYLSNKSVPREKIRIVPNGVDVDMFCPNDSGGDLRNLLGLSDPTFVVMYAGALGMANDVYTILRAASHLMLRQESIRIVIVGDGKERKALALKAREDGLNNVIFTGPIPKTDIPRYLATADVCVATLMNIPMFTTTYPNKVFDYMAAGRPTILLIDGVIREVIESAGGGVFVTPGDHQGLASVIERLSENRAEAQRMGQAARRFVVEKFDRREQARLFGRVLAELRG